MRTVSQDNIDAMRTALQQLPPNPAAQATVREAIQALAADIQRVREEKRYSWQDVIELLAQHGIAISVPTLKEYLRQATTPTKKSPPAQRPQRPQADTKPNAAVATPKAAKPTLAQPTRSAAFREDV